MENANKDFKNLNINIEKNLLREFKSRASQNGTTMTKILLDAIREYLNREV